MALIAMVAAAAAAAQVPADPAVLDVRCFLVTAALRESEDPAIRAAGEQASLYYFGRIDGRTPDVDLEAVMTREWLLIADEDRQLLLRACGELLTRRGQAMVEAGRRMQEREAAQQPPSAQPPQQ